MAGIFGGFEDAHRILPEIPHFVRDDTIPNPYEFLGKREQGMPELQVIKSPP